MDAGIADTLNRQTARQVAEHLDRLDLDWDNGTPWYRSTGSTAFTGENPDVTSADRAWYFAILATGTPFDGEPADCDWDDLFASFRTEIMARRDPEFPSVRAAEIPVRDGVGSR